jgi:DNA-binding CsgD family transcriptional regulator
MSNICISVDESLREAPATMTFVPATEPLTVTIADLVRALGSDRFSLLLNRYLESGVSADVLFAYAIRTDAEEAALLMSGTTQIDRIDEHRALLSEYAERGFSADPLIKSMRGSFETTPFVKVRHASEVEDIAFRQQYFDDMGDEEELSIVGGRGSTELLYIGFFGHHFSEAETRFATEQAPLILALLQKDRELRKSVGCDVPAAPPSRDAALRGALAKNPARLTQREVEVCAQIMRGLTAEAIASRLGISAHTVVTHRKRAYAKLCISSQAELFAKIYQVAIARGGLVTSSEIPSVRMTR